MVQKQIISRGTFGLRSSWMVRAAGLAPRRWRQRLRIGSPGVLVLMLCLNLTGCGLSPSESDDDHIVHQIPIHKPATFADAVDQIRLRHARLVKDFSTEDTNVIERQLTELIDIVGWLPELAADSPMKKREWDQTKVASKTLLMIYQGVASMAKGHPRGEWPIDSSRTAEPVAALVKLSPFTASQL